MPGQRRVWCSSVIIDYLQGADRAKPDCQLIVEQAERGEIEILVSTLTIAEVTNLRGVIPDEAEASILEFFRRSYIVLVTVDIGVAEVARRLRRTHGLKTVDSVHMATALHHGVSILESYDEDLLKLSEKEGQPFLTIRPPTYEGQRPLL